MENIGEAAAEEKEALRIALHRDRRPPMPSSAASARTLQMREQQIGRVTGDDRLGQDAFFYAARPAEYALLSERIAAPAAAAAAAVAAVAAAAAAVANGGGGVRFACYVEHVRVRASAVPRRAAADAPQPHGRPQGGGGARCRGARPQN